LNAFYLPFFQHLFYPHYLHIVAHARGLVNTDIIGYQLRKIFVGCHAINLVAFGFGLFGQCADNVIRFITVRSNHRDVEAEYQFINIGQRLRKVFRHRFAMCLVSGKIGMAFSWGIGVKTTAMWVGFSFRNTSSSVLVKPITADVFNPPDVNRGVLLKAKCARYIRAMPSKRNNFFIDFMISPILRMITPMPNRDLQKYNLSWSSINHLTIF